jgi:hypothetical protein
MARIVGLCRNQKTNGSSEPITRCLTVGQVETMGLSQDHWTTKGVQEGLERGRFRWSREELGKNIKLCWAGNRNVRERGKMSCRYALEDAGAEVDEESRDMRLEAGDWPERASGWERSRIQNICQQVHSVPQQTDGIWVPVFQYPHASRIIQKFPASRLRGLSPAFTMVSCSIYSILKMEATCYLET